MAQVQPVRLLIAALGGEGGGVLASWITEACSAGGLVVSRTSIPGVAQRTGATTYYIEVAQPSGSANPILGLNPAPGQVDILLATELLEAARMVQAGFVTPQRTLLVATERRVYTTDEKVSMSDGRVDPDQLLGVLRRFSRRLVLVDLADIASSRRSHVNAVMLGILAGLRVVPIETERFRAAVIAGGKAVDANLRGFDAGLEVSGRKSDASSTVAPRLEDPASEHGLSRFSDFPLEAHTVLQEAVARLADYQDDAYAALYLARVGRIAGLPGADGNFVSEFARHLALRMTVEDVIRVAQLKLRGARIARVTREARAREGDIVDITEFMKPGPEEVLGLLPPRFGRWALSRVRQDRSWPLKVRTTRFSGFLRLRMLAGLKFWRPRTLRFAQEEAWIERWLRLVERTLAVDAAAAREVVATAGLVRGYSGTYKRGVDNWSRIMQAVVEPCLSGALPRHQFADAVLQARLAATKDPEGEALSKTINAINRAAVPGKAAAE